MLVGLVAGRAAEELVFDTVTSGAANDIERATDIARAMVTQYGMSKKFGLIGLATVQNRYLDGSATLNCSDATAAEIDQEVIAILKESYEKALELLGANRELMDKLAEFLIEKETITGKEFMKIYRAEKGIPEPKEEPKAAAESKAVEEPKAAEESKAEVEPVAQPEPQEEPEPVDQQEPEAKQESEPSGVPETKELGRFTNAPLDQK